MTRPTRNHPDELVVGLVSISDRASQGVYEDKGIPSLETWLGEALATPWRTETRLIQDDAATISATLVELVDVVGCDLVLTTGGTGPSRRDVTPEATLEAIEREVPGIAEAIRADSIAKTPHALLSRGVAGTIGSTLVVNLPGSPGGCRDGYAVMQKALEHALRLLSGETTTHRQT